MTTLYIVVPNNKYTGELSVYGPYDDEQHRDDGAQLLLFLDKSDTHLYFMDIAPDGKPRTWKPSEAYIDDLRQKWEAQEKEETPQ